MNDEVLDAIVKAKKLKEKADDLLNEMHDILQPITDAAIQRASKSHDLSEMKDLLEHLPPGSGSQKSDLRAAITSMSLG